MVRSDLEKPSPDATRDFVIRIATVVIAVVVVGAAVLLGTALYVGTAAIPVEVQAHLWNIMIGLLVVVSGAATVYFNSRNTDRITHATTTHSDLNAVQTQAAISKVSDIVQNGLPKRTAEMVKEDADRAALLLAAAAAATTTAAEAQRIAAQVAANVESISSMRATTDSLATKLDGITSVLAQIALSVPVPPAPPADVTLQAIETNTAATAANTQPEAGP